MEGVSFVVPVHNGAACVREALESILGQADGRPMEIIVVDDSSQDD
jgi:glycosyltransferase involved in cell wall biosynthesis